MEIYSAEKSLVSASCYKSLLDASKDLTTTRTREGVENVVVSVGNSVVKGTIGPNSAILFVFLAQGRFATLPSILDK